MTSTTSALRKMAFVRQPPADAFRLFTDHIAEWWPLDTHSVGLQNARTVRFEPGVGGRIVETIDSVDGGATAVWGTVLAWEPPARVRFTWHPGIEPTEATEVEVTFVETADGTTVTLIHTGWDRRPDGAQIRSNYDSGWDFVLGRYATATTSTAAG